MNDQEIVNPKSQIVNHLWLLFLETNSSVTYRS